MTRKLMAAVLCLLLMALAAGTASASSNGAIRLETTRVTNK